MDTRTLALALVIMSATLAVLWWLVAWRRRDPALTLWAWGLTSVVLGFASLPLQSVVPGPTVTILGNLFLVGYNLSLVWGLRIFQAHPKPWPWRWGLYLGLWLAAMVAFAVIHPWYPGRVVATSTVLALFFAEFLAELSSARSTAPRRVRVLLGAVALAYIAFHGARIAALPFGAAASVLADSRLTVPTLVSSLITGILMAGGLLLLDSSRLQDRIQAGADELRRLNLLKDRILAMTGHDLRGPLGNLRAVWEDVALLSREGRLAEMDPRLPDLVDRSLAGTQSLLDNLFDFAAGTGPRPGHRTDLEAPVRAAVDLWSVAARTKGVALVCEVQGETEVGASADAVGAVLRNLVGNAVKFTPGGGSVAVRVVGGPEGTGTVVVEVEDTGIGMEAAGQGSGGLSPSRPGTEGERGSGFGLLLVRELVKGWGGTLEFRPGRPRGTLVRVGLPGILRPRPGPLP